MDEPLPVLKNFEATPPDPPEPWWTRYFAYVFFILAMPFVSAIIALGWDVYNSNRHRMHPSAEQFGIIVEQDMFIAAVLGLVGSVIASVFWEVRVIRTRRQQDGANDGARNR